MKAHGKSKLADRLQVRPWPAWNCPRRPRTGSHPDTPTLSRGPPAGACSLVLVGPPGRAPFRSHPGTPTHPPSHLFFDFFDGRCCQAKKAKKERELQDKEQRELGELKKRQEAEKEERERLKAAKVLWTEALQVRPILAPYIVPFLVPI